MSVLKREYGPSTPETSQLSGMNGLCSACANVAHIMARFSSGRPASTSRTWHEHCFTVPMTLTP